jgi:hypothetical protein
MKAWSYYVWNILYMGDFRTAAQPWRTHIPENIANDLE